MIRQRHLVLIVYIPVVVLKNCKPELSYILALMEGFIGGPVFKNIGERFIAKNYHPISLLSVVSKVFEKLVNNRIVDHLEKCGLFFGFLVF